MSHAVPPICIYAQFTRQQQPLESCRTEYFGILDLVGGFCSANRLAAKMCLYFCDPHNVSFFFFSVRNKYKQGIKLSLFEFPDLLFISSSNKRKSTKVGDPCCWVGSLQPLKICFGRRSGNRVAFSFCA